MNILLTFLIGVSSPAFAGMGDCPAHVLKDPDSLRMIQYLREVSGSYRLGSCTLELQVCTLNPNSQEEGTVIADMVVVDRKGFERYVPFFAPEYQQRKSRQMQLQNNRMLHYRFFDTNRDSATGADERWMIEFVKTDDLKSLEYVEVGYSSEVQREKKIAKKWIICGADREHEVYGHPLRHKFKSWWHRLTN